MEYQYISLLSDVINMLSTLILFSIGANACFQIYQEDFKRKYKIYKIYISMKFYNSKSMVTELKKWQSIFYMIFNLSPPLPFNT